MPPDPLDGSRLRREIVPHNFNALAPPLAVQNRVQLREKLLRTYEELVANMRSYESLSTTMRTLYVKELRILEKTMETHEAQGDLGHISKVNQT